MHVRCPHCHNPLEVVDDVEFSDIPCPSCGSSFSLVGEETLAHVSTRKTIGHFELVEQIGIGAFGAVWKARDTELDRMVAVKIPRKEQLDDTESEQFLREARAAAQLKHPSIVAVHEVGREDGQVYIVSDFVQGATLADWSEGRQLAAREAARLCEKTARALHHAHQAGIIHRDLKPSNIMMDLDGEPHIMDFGLAKREASEITMTIEGRLIGTPAYMSPEQARGEAHQADARSDVYSLSVVLYRLLTGELPFRGNPRMLIVQILKDDPPLPRTLNGNIPRDLETICLKAMAREPDRRYETAAAFADDLNRFLSGEAIHARPVGTAERAWRWVQRRPTIAALIGVSIVAAMALVGVLVSAVYSQQLKRAHAAETQARLAEESHRALAERSLYFHSVSLAQRAWLSGNVGRAEELLDSCSADQRGWEWNYLKRQCHVELLTWRPTPQQVSDVVFSPDGRSIAAIGGLNAEAWVWDISSGKQLHHFDPGQLSATCVAFHPDGSRLVGLASLAYVDGELRVWNLKTGDEVLHVPALHGYSHAAYSPDGSQLVVATSGGERTPGSIRLLDAESGDLVREYPGHPQLSTRVAFSQDGRWVASSAGMLDIFDPGQKSGELRIIDTTGGADVHVVPLPHTDGGIAMALSPDGTRIASNLGRQITIRELSSGREIIRLQASSVVQGLAYNHDASQLVSGGLDGSVQLWDSLSGQNLIRFRGHRGHVNAVAFNGDGTRIASAADDGTVRVWDATVDPTSRVLSADGALILCVAFSPDAAADLLVAGDGRGTIHSWSIATGTKSAEPLALDGPVWDLAFSADGSRLAAGGGDWSKLEEPGFVQVHDVSSGNVIEKWEGHIALAWDVDFSPDGSWLASAGGELNNPGEVLLWGLDRNVTPKRFESNHGAMACVAVSPDGAVIAAGAADGSVLVWDVESGRLLHEFHEHQVFVMDVEFQSQGKHGLLIASCDITGAIRLHDAATGEVKRAFHEANAALAMAFSPDGRRLASTGLGTIITLWDVESGLGALELHGHTSVIFDIAFSPDGRLLASCGRDGTVRIWDASPLQP